MLVKVAECCALRWEGGELVWDGYLEHQQYALTEASERVMRWFADWRELGSLGELDEPSLAVARLLLEVGVLLEQGSERHLREQAVLARWGPWGAAARYFHFATRTLEQTPFVDPGDDAEHMRERAWSAPFPELTKRYPEAAAVDLAAGWEAPAEARAATLLDALASRRSVRQFEDREVPLGHLSSLLCHAAGIRRTVRDPSIGTAVHKASPASGALHPIELYLWARAVAGLPSGLYHYEAISEVLERVGEAPADNGPGAFGGQPWLAEAPAVLIFTGLVERTQWRYGSGRAYRDVLLGLGHLSQTVLLLATSLGLGAVFASAVRDEALERILGCDGRREPVLGVTALGWPAFSISEHGPGSSAGAD